MKDWMRKVLLRLPIRAMANYVVKKAREEAEKTETEIDDIAVDIIEDLLDIAFGK